MDLHFLAYNYIVQHRSKSEESSSEYYAGSGEYRYPGNRLLEIMDFVPSGRWKIRICQGVQTFAGSMS